MNLRRGENWSDIDCPTLCSCNRAVNNRGKMVTSKFFTLYLLVVMSHGHHEEQIRFFKINTVDSIQAPILTRLLSRRIIDSYSYCYERARDRYTFFSVVMYRWLWLRSKKRFLLTLSLMVSPGVLPYTYCSSVRCTWTENNKWVPHPAPHK